MAVSLCRGSAFDTDDSSLYVESKVIENFTFALCEALDDVGIFASLLVSNEFMSMKAAKDITMMYGVTDTKKILILLRKVVGRIETSTSAEDAESVFKRFVTQVLCNSDLQLSHVVEPMEDRHSKFRA